jgi:GNAT superfamily N-acetyltransferase
MKLSVTDAPPPHARDVIAAGLGAFNTAQAGPGEWRRLTVLIHDEQEVVTGGLWGVTSYGWLFTELLFIPEELRGRGLGSEVLGRAEAEARARGCRQAWLDTFEFQARGFYERLRYRLFAELADYPPGQSRYFLRKTL